MASVINKLLEVCQNLEENVGSSGGSSSGGSSGITNDNIANIGRGSQLNSSLIPISSQTRYRKLGDWNSKKLLYIWFFIKESSDYIPIYYVEIFFNPNYNKCMKIYNVSDTGDNTKDSSYGSLKFELCKLDKTDGTSYLALKFVKSTYDAKIIDYFVDGIDPKVSTSGYDEIVVENDSPSKLYTEKALTINDDKFITIFIPKSTQPAI